MYSSASRSYRWTSEPQMPHARTRISTSSGATGGSGRSVTRKRGRRHTRLPLRASRRSAAPGSGATPPRGAHSASTSIACMDTRLPPATSGLTPWSASRERSRWLTERLRHAQVCDQCMANRRDWRRRPDGVLVSGSHETAIEVETTANALDQYLAILDAYADQGVES